MSNLGTGTTIAFDSGFFAEVTDIRPFSAERPSIDMTHMGSTPAREFDPGDLVDWGEGTIEMHYFPDTAPPIDDAKETMTITFADSAATAISFTAFMTNFEPRAPLEDKLVATARLKIDGAVS